MGIFGKLLADDRGVSAIEYCLLTAFVALGLVTSVGQLGMNIAASFGDVHAAMVSAVAGTDSDLDGKDAPVTEDPGNGQPGKGKPAKGKPGKGNPGKGKP